MYCQIYSFIHSFMSPSRISWFCDRRNWRLQKIKETPQHSEEFANSRAWVQEISFTDRHHRENHFLPSRYRQFNFRTQKKKKNSFRKGSQQNQAFFAATSPVRTDFLLAADWQTITSWWTHFWCTIYSIRYDIYATSPTPTSPNFPGFSALYLSFRENL